MKPKANPVEELAKRVNEKARELQNVQESVDAAHRKIADLQQHEQRLRKDADALEAQIKERREALDALIQLEYKFLSNIKTERSKESEALEKIRKGISELSQEQSVLGMMTDDARTFAAYRDEYKKEYLDVKAKFEAAEQAKQEALRMTETLFRDASVRQKEMDYFKQNLTDFYGKVATFVRTAEETLEFVNQELERKGTPIRFAIPEGQIMEFTLENFNKQA